MLLGKLIIDWTQMPTYNTIMAIAAGAGLCSIADTIRKAGQSRQITPEGWAINFGALGILLFFTGLHMALTWPMARYFPFDNIIFGEPSLAFGCLLLALAFYCWKRSVAIKAAEAPLKEMAADILPFRFFIYGTGLALIAVACAGINFKLFAAPAEEPITGLFADYPMLEATGISLLYAMIGVSALLTPGILSQFARGDMQSQAAKRKAVYLLMMLTGGVWMVFGALNFFTHIGLIIHTMG